MVLLATAALLLVGCETPMTSSEEHFGESVRSNTEAMLATTRNKDGTPREPHSIDGPTANGISENYHHNEQSDQQRSRIEDSGIVSVDQTR